jgi:DNA-binding Lrp family transcriptional regulator
MLDGTDKKLLNIVQTAFPVVPEPYRELAGQLGLSEEEVLARLRRLVEAKVIRRLGAIFDSRKVGYEGTLCALKVPPERVAEVAAEVNRHSGVTHNYLRDHEYNMWFTVLAGTPEKVNEIVQEIKERTGIKDCLFLPAVNIFKIRVNFDLA